MTPDQIDTAAQHFTDAAVWAEKPEGTDPRESRESFMAALRFVQRFAAAYPELCDAAMQCDGYGSHPDAGSPAAAFGHDLFLTCAGHGVGFDDRAELGEIGESLADAIRRDWRRWYVETQFYRGWLYLHCDGRSETEKAA